MSVMPCGDAGCPCRNLPPAVDDTEALRAEVVRLQAVVGRVRAVCDETEAQPWATGPTRIVGISDVRAALDGGAAT